MFISRGIESRRKSTSSSSSDTTVFEVLETLQETEYEPQIFVFTPCIIVYCTPCIIVYCNYNYFKL